VVKEVLVVLLVHQENVDIVDVRDLMGLMVPPVHKAPLDRQEVPLVHLVLMVHKEKEVLMAHKDQLVLLVLKDQLVHKGNKVIKD